MCSLWRNNSYIIGTLYISPNFVAFQSNFTVSGKDLQVGHISGIHYYFNFFDLIIF